MKMLKKLKKEGLYEFHKWKKQLLILDKIIAVFVFILLGFFRQDLLLIKIFILLIPYLIITKRRSLFYHLSIAFVISIIWNIIAKDQYTYNQNFLSLFSISLFPLFAWSLGLFAIYLIYSHYEHKLYEKGFLRKVLLFVLIYWPLLIIVETVAYHLFNIHNVAAQAYPGLPICNCIHAPLWMQLSYFLLGPIFFTACYFLRLENPHYKAIAK